MQEVQWSDHELAAYLRKKGGGWKYQSKNLIPPHTLFYAYDDKNMQYPLALVIYNNRESTRRIFID